MRKLTSNTRGRVALFAAGLVAAFGAAFALGSLVDPADTESEEHGMGGGHGAHGAESAHGAHSATMIEAPAGLGVSEGGYTLRTEPFFVRAGEPRQLRFHVEGPGGEAVRDFDREHERDLHLIVVRRDGTNFQHLHPEMAADGTWTQTLALPAAGSYRAFADFSVGGEARTLATDLSASGTYEPRPFPASTPVDRTAGYEVRLSGAQPRSGQESLLRFAVSENGRPVADLQNYLGAKGHLVALREGDLAYLHVHPTASRHPGEIRFEAHFPTSGRYRLFLQFRHEDIVRTASYTVEVAR